MKMAAAHEKSMTYERSQFSWQLTKKGRLLGAATPVNASGLSSIVTFSIFYRQSRPEPIKSDRSPFQIDHPYTEPA
jgi:hypothetical protein